MAKTNRTNKKAAALAVRRGLALGLRIQGGSYPKIAQTMQAARGQEQYADVIPPGYDHAAAYKDVAAELERLNKENGEDAELLRRQMFEQVMELWSVYFPMALKKDLFAANYCLSLQNQIIRLFSLDKQPQGGSQDSGFGQITIEEWRAKQRKQIEQADEAIEIFGDEFETHYRTISVST